MSFLKNFIRDEQGQDVVEYAILVGLLAVAGITTYLALGGAVKTSLEASEGKLTAAPASSW
jgi:pilus assembly protein Flp/PilA